MQRPLLFLSVFMLIASRVVARPNFRDYASASDEDLVARVRDMDADAILELGYRKNHPAVASLERIASQGYQADAVMREKSRGNAHSAKIVRENLSSRHAKARLSAKMALARLGNRKYFEEFVVGLSTGNPFYREQCIQALGYVGDKRALKYLGPILFESAGPPSYSPHDLRDNFATTAEISIGMIIPELAKKHWVNSRWREWWEQNKNRFQ